MFINRQKYQNQVAGISCSFAHFSCLSSHFAVALSGLSCSASEPVFSSSQWMTLLNSKPFFKSCQRSFGVWRHSFRADSLWQQCPSAQSQKTSQAEGPSWTWIVFTQNQTKQGCTKSLKSQCQVTSELPARWKDSSGSSWRTARSHSLQPPTWAPVGPAKWRCGDEWLGTHGPT